MGLIMSWSSLDWKALDRLRAGFLSGEPRPTPYWESVSDLEVYDRTYAERIGWKWDTVLKELTLRRWAPDGAGRLTLLDWGCGSGVAARRVAAFLGQDSLREIVLWDHSPRAREFATARLRARFPGLAVREATDATEAADVLVVSHVLNELTPAAESDLTASVLRSRACVWVEPGTHAVARRLQAWRDRLRFSHTLIAPCPHQGACGLLTPGHEVDWCHHFAPPPPGVHADPDWVRFARLAGIDLRSLPFAFLVAERDHSLGSDAAGLARILGRPESIKPEVRVLACEADFVGEVRVPRRTAAALAKALERERGPLVYRWRREGTTVASGQHAWS
jgi:SAM-dependent methyltransferase